MKFFRFFSDVFNVFTKARQIRESGNAKEKSVRFALSAIIYSAVMLVTALGGAYLLSVYDNSVLFLFLLLIGVVLLVSAAVTFTAALLRVIVQFTLNKGVMSWIALAVLAGTTAGAVTGLILML